MRLTCSLESQVSTRAHCEQVRIYADNLGLAPNPNLSSHLLIHTVSFHSQAIRVGDVYALMVEWFYSQQQMKREIKQNQDIHTAVYIDQRIHTFDSHLIFHSQAIRVGDVYALMVESFYSQQKMKGDKL